VPENTTKICFKHRGCSKEGKESEKTVDTKPSDMIVGDFEASIATDQNISVAAKLTEDDMCETVTSAHPQLT
jgi:hypothetical protein